ncbi:putative transmembrane channel-like protein 7 [Apostichopus japonicus]|uniref:Putative transmembrane channel-like protein 7 n=1 Tax=Stichopus japonicus TaxID=307972 RepID=A0A2G8KFI1_STIJA|nr:putative transmembrane channel-like protein 7 [Apostichopus japonicus]
MTAAFRPQRVSSDVGSQLNFNLESRTRNVEIACKLELDMVAKEDTIPDALKEQRYVHIIRNSALSIPKKRRTVAKYLQKQRVGNTNNYKDKNEDWRKVWKNFKSKVKDFGQKFVFWGSSIKTVEGNFGIAIVSYFVFLRWLFFLNLIIACLLFTFVILPEFFIDGDAVREYYNVQNDECALAYVDSIDDTCITNGSVSHCLENFLTGEGWMEETLLFYGTFIPDMVAVNLSSTALLGQNSTAVQGLILSYNRPVAYITTTVIYLTLCLIVMLRYAMSLLEKSLVYSSSKEPLKFSTLVLSGWDFSVREPKKVKYKERNLLLEFQVSLEVQRLEVLKEGQHIGQRLGIYGVRMLVHFLVILSNLCAYYLIYFTTQFNVRTDIESEGLRSIAELGFEWLPSITLVLLNNALPKYITRIVQYEVYTPSFEVNMNIIRTSFLKLASLLVLLFSLYNNISCPESEKDSCGACGVTDSLVLSCWETVVGQEFYKLTVVDLLSKVAAVYTWEYPRKESPRPRKNSIVWGIVKVRDRCVFLPFLPVITTVKFFILFYVRKFSLLHNMQPSGREARASQSTFFFVVLLIVTFLMCLVPVVFALVTLALIYQYNQAAASGQLIELLKKHLTLEKKSKHILNENLRRILRQAKAARTE